ncbi:MAG TPA: hypothetical protein VIK60_06440 [Vicinamibacterales bacterium]
MYGGRLAATALSLALATSCGGMTDLTPTAASERPPASPFSLTDAPVSSPHGRELEGTIGPFDAGTLPCFANLFPCETLDFTLPHEGPIEVTLTWEGHARALFVQLYWEGRWLAHEDVAPRGGPSQISFLRPKMEANDYQLRIVTREPALAIPFRLVLSY